MRLLLATVGALGLIACSTEGAQQPAPTASPTPAPTASPIAASGGCGSTAAIRGSTPAWLDDAGAHNNPTGVPYVIAHPPLAAGFLFGSPLRAGHPDNPTNKILWVVRTPRSGALTIDGHPLGAVTPAIHERDDANSSPGQIYPSIVDVPTAGCWQSDLRWANSQAQVELTYIAT
ncbi:MAG TPA: hypothetical protein VG104_04775 [Candidatus Dormibacteraeota bacterium]|nr:hypothetical protein [Candidatus Dormibacteraeota bacterium]